jgi:hypothetical protein
MAKWKDHLAPAVPGPAPSATSSASSSPAFEITRPTRAGLVGKQRDRAPVSISMLWAISADGAVISFVVTQVGETPPKQAPRAKRGRAKPSTPSAKDDPSTSEADVESEEVIPLRKRRSPASKSRERPARRARTGTISASDLILPGGTTVYVEVPNKKPVTTVSRWVDALRGLLRAVTDAMDTDPSLAKSLKPMWGRLSNMLDIEAITFSQMKSLVLDIQEMVLEVDVKELIRPLHALEHEMHSTMTLVSQ